jgi:hypothetical protein
VIKAANIIVDAWKDPYFFEMITPQSHGIDQTFGVECSWGLFSMLNYPASSMYPPENKNRLVGHGGSTAHLFFTNLDKKYTAVFLSDSHLSLPQSRKRDYSFVSLMETLSE